MELSKGNPRVFSLEIFLKNLFVMSFTYAERSATREHIFEHLSLCDEYFKPPLSSRVTIIDYSRKIFEEAISFEAWENTVLVGMVNAYLNDLNTQVGFITNVSVLKEFMGRGIGSYLLNMCMIRARDLGYYRLALEVSPDNFTAIALYKKVGFIFDREVRNNILMVCNLNENTLKRIS